MFISINGNPATYLASTAFTQNGYVGDTTSATNGQDNSLAWAGGEKVFYGKSTDYDTAGFITSVADLGTLNAGDTVSVSFKAEWDDFTIEGPPAWDIAGVKITDGAAAAFLDVTIVDDGPSGFTVTNSGSLPGPWSYISNLLRFELDADAKTADRYQPDFHGSVIDLNNATIQLVVLAGELAPGDSFSLFNLAGGTTITGSLKEILLPNAGTWDTGDLATNGTITYVAPPPTLTWNVAGAGDWDTTTDNWTEDGGVTTTTYKDGVEVIFNNPVGGLIGKVAARSPLSTTVDSEGVYTFATGQTPGVPSILSGTLTKNGNGVLRLGDFGWNNTADAGTYANGFTSVRINAGTVHYGSRLAFGDATVTLEDGTALRKVGQEGNGPTLNMPNNLVLNGTINLHIQFADFKDQWFSGQITGPGGITVTGERRALSLTGDNTFAGGVVMENYIGNPATGTVSLYNLDIGHANALGTGPLTVRTVLLQNPSSADSAPSWR